MARPERTIHNGQLRLSLDKDHTEHLILAGVRYGKSYYGPNWHYQRVRENAKLGAKLSLVVAPDFKLAKQVCLVYYKNFLLGSGLREGKHFTVNKSDLAIYFPKYDHTVLTLSGETPDKIIGYTSSHAWNDEAAKSPEEVRENLLQRNSFTCDYQQILHTTTPIGTENWLYDVFGPHKVPRIDGTPHSISKKESKIVLHGRTHDNPYLSQKYLDTLERELSWDDAYYRNYVLGEWVSLGKNRFYYHFDERRHVGDYPPDPSNHMLYLSFDNNIDRMAWVVAQEHDEVEKGLKIVKANKADAHNWKDACEQFRKAFPPAQWKRHRIAIYGDAVMWHRSTGDSSIPFILIKRWLERDYPMVELRAKRKNPFISDRSLCTNRFFGEDRLVIDKDCSAVILSARTAQTDRNGKIKKPKDEDVTHPMEAVDRITMALDPITSVLYQGYDSDDDDD